MALEETGRDTWCQEPPNEEGRGLLPTCQGRWTAGSSTTSVLARVLWRNRSQGERETFIENYPCSAFVSSPGPPQIGGCPLTLRGGGKLLYSIHPLPC